MEIDWHSKSSHFFINPRTPTYEKNRISKIIDEYNLSSHIFLATSGSTATLAQDIKWVALNKSAILSSSQSVNEHLECTSKDIILNSLPYFHIGGLSTFSRAFLCGAKIINIYADNLKWNPSFFVNEIENNKVTITSLVPTQIFDIVMAKLKSPISLRAVVVGGGSLSFNLYRKALKLGWPLLSSYGMTECCSQVATALLNINWNSSYPNLKILSHLKVKINDEGKICISGNSLLTGYILQNEGKAIFLDPKESSIPIFKDNDKYIQTSDLGSVQNGYLNVFGRADDVFKISGENVSLTRLDEILQDIISVFNLCFEVVLFAPKDNRLERKIVLAVLEKNKNELNLLNKIVIEFNKKVFPFERIRSIHFINSIPRTELGKLKRNQLSLSFAEKDGPIDF